MTPEMIAHLERLEAWRALPREEQIARLGGGGPGLLEKAASLAHAVADHAADGGRKASAEVRAARKLACFSCAHHRPESDACSACGCGVNPVLSFLGLDLDLKRSWASSACPGDPPLWGPS